MDPIEEVVFIITPAGYSALRNARDPLNIQLRTVLTLVDGVCTVAQYQPYLLAFAPLPDKFISLEYMGYLQRAPSLPTRI